MASRASNFTDCSDPVRSHCSPVSQWQCSGASGKTTPSSPGEDTYTRPTSLSISPRISASTARKLPGARRWRIVDGIVGRYGRPFAPPCLCVICSVGVTYSFVALSYLHLLAPTLTCQELSQTCQRGLGLARPHFRKIRQSRHILFATPAMSLYYCEQKQCIKS